MLIPAEVAKPKQSKLGGMESDYDEKRKKDNEFDSVLFQVDDGSYKKRKTPSPDEGEEDVINDSYNMSKTKHSVEQSQQYMHTDDNMMNNQTEQNEWQISQEQNFKGDLGDWNY